MAGAGKVLEAIGELLKRGYSAKEVFFKTGYKKMPDGEWLNTSKLLAPAAVGAASMGASDDAEASFIGKMAKTFAWDAHTLAKKLEDAGASRDEIWKQTGEMGTPLYRDDGKWKQEISDQGMSLDPYAIGTRDSGWRSGKSDVLVHPDFKAAYPEAMENTTFSFNPRHDSQGEYSSISSSETMGWPEEHFVTVKDSATPGRTKEQVQEKYRKLIKEAEDTPVEDYMEFYDLDEAGAAAEKAEDLEIYREALAEAKDDPFFKKGTLSTVAHENQHLAQNVEGFARGGNPQQFYEELGDRKRFAEGEIAAINHELSGLANAMDKLRQHNTPAAKKNLEYVQDRYNALLHNRSEYIEDASIDISEEAFKKYQRLGGEAESRNVQSRLGMTMEERMARPPWTTLDVPENELIYTYRTPTVTSLLAGGLATAGALSPQDALAGQRPASTGTIEAAKAPYMETLANALRSVDTPIGKPFENLADWAHGVAYQDDDKLSRAAWGALDIAP